MNASTSLAQLAAWVEEQIPTRRGSMRKRVRRSFNIGFESGQERLLEKIGLTTTAAQEASARNAFQIGRDYERSLHTRSRQ